MIEILNWVVGSAFLVLLSYIDIRTYDKENGCIPSVLTSLFLILAFLVGFPNSIFSGILGGLIALLLTDLEFWGGVADFKVFIASSMLFPDFVQASIFAGFVTVLGVLYKVVVVKVMKRTEGNIPFIPVFLFAFFFSFLLFLVLKV